MEKILTIVVPAYNMEKYIEETLKSMIEPTTMDDLEVIVVDDGSIDNTSKIVKKYVKQYPNTFKLIKKENGGHGSALNVGLDNANGKYYRPIDADDWVDTESLKYVIKDLKKHSVDMVITNFRKVLEKSNRIINVRCKNVYNRKEIIDGLVKSIDNREINIYDYEYDFNKDIYDYAPQYLYHFVMYKTSLLKDNKIKFSEKVFYDDMEYDIYPLPFVKTVLPIGRYLYMYRLEREGQSVENESFIKHRTHRYRIVLNLSKYFADKKNDFGVNVYNHLFPDMVWKAERQYEIYLSSSDENAKKEMIDFDKNLLETNSEIYNAIKKDYILLFRKTHNYSKSKEKYLCEINESKRNNQRPKAWTLESDPIMHKMIKNRRLLNFVHLKNEEMKKISKLHNSQTAKRCFITCTGPSLTISDLELLSNEITIGVNSIVKAYDKTEWRPTYYAMVDYFAFGDFLNKEDIPGKILCKENAFLHYRVDPKFKTGKEIYCLVDYSNHFKNRVKENNIKLSNNLSVCAYDAYTVTIFAIQIAIYLGFKEIYIIGADCNYSGKQIHFVEMPDDNKKIAAGWLPDALALSIEGYKAALKFANKHSVKIFNATRGGNLEVFPRVNLEDVLKK